ncbi:SIMPL domain-containing protein [Bacteroides sp. OttesenSCG-928-D19]|nr:SIMPL domain-containing protein [Bacteroides sp. OttesenSCG-928-N06]MDL2306080.1 SIMPL domain-containing protein [Bacteroides sp. OttesenSCG-928-D19]
MNKKFFTSIALLVVFLGVTSCNSKVQEGQQSVSVSGIGTVLAQPDMVLMNVCFSHTASTTKEAKKAVEQTMQQILGILKAENVEDKFLKTISLNYDVEYDYRNGRRVKLGQRAQQTIVVTVNDMVNTPERFSSILDKITAIDRVEVQNIQFDIENKTELFKQSRELAYQKAFDKARQYAELSGRKIGSVLTISEAVSRDIMQTRAFQNNMAFKEQALSMSDASGVPTGEQGVSSEINVVFSLE